MVANRRTVPFCHRASHTMANKTKRTVIRRKQPAKQQVKQVTKQLKKLTPFADAGNIVGKKLGSMFNMPYLQGVGKWLGSGIGSIFGSGDYTITGEPPSYNVMMNGAQIPKFSTTQQTNIVCHRECLGDISSTTSFNNLTFPLNPGMNQTFPWLSTVAQNYQEYKFHGLIFEFRSCITDFAQSGSPGFVVMATNYNADYPAYTSKIEMENSEYAVATKPTTSLMHGVECAIAQTALPMKYIRSGSLPTGTDLKTYDQGLFQFATTQATTGGQLIGELWVSYCVEFFKPVMPTDTGGNMLSYHYYRTGVTNATPLGTASTITVGDLSIIAISGTTLAWNAPIGNRYLVTLTWLGSVAAAIAYPTVTATLGGVLKQYYLNDTSTFFSAPNNGVSATAFSMSFIVESNSSYLGNTVGFALGTGGTLPTTNTTLDVVITQLSSEVNA